MMRGVHHQVSCANPVTLVNLRHGIRERLDYVQNKGKSKGDEWPHNELYRELERHRTRGLDEEFWDFLVDTLTKWSAIRGTEEHTKEAIHTEGLKRLPELRRCFYRLARNGNSKLPTVETVEWADVEPLFNVAWQVKKCKNNSPVFASKLCHFLVPSAYFIFDNTLVKPGWNEYRDYWEDCRRAWLDRSDKQALRPELRKKIPDPCSTFPWPTKITELCQFPND
ncbi:MAG: hypothetical protein HY000_40700 [Planctomycetes bacterium]|nr:hypothetical protein [Planctomycetota bacterium]